ncbi:HAMP domain-containing sensor histidine kinase [Bacillus sp. FJAT-50079]|uniref:sensor histidine kinase n=1 Tax=Bacillus sp. FJAT-50079 TaxID=2833577 RepID=UPI001BC9C1E8|nr:HAMP domain-containing sensor histidine kinase [Bacillus sp. FJAT-50079]MBS4206997.1 HAMP domain-containing histidine kinase [Bacillus sp. FJAT-50079]
MIRQLFNRISRKKQDNNIDTNQEEVNVERQTANYDEIVGRMSAFFAHEIRNPLTSIIGFTQFLEQDEVVQANPKIQHYLSIIKDEALRMEALIQELLSLATTDFQRDNVSIVDVKYIIEKTVIIFQMQPEYQNIYFNTSLLEEVYIKGNADRLEQLLINLINNAIEACGKDCSIDIFLEKDSENVSILIADNGIGIPVDQIDQIFYPLFTTKDTGSGIGLPVCKAIVETLGGTITLQNRLPKGTEVRVEIPLIKHSS